MVLKVAMVCDESGVTYVSMASLADENRMVIKTMTSKIVDCVRAIAIFRIGLSPRKINKDASSPSY